MAIKQKLCYWNLQKKTFIDTTCDSPRIIHPPSQKLNFLQNPGYVEQLFWSHLFVCFCPLVNISISAFQQLTDVTRPQRQTAIHQLFVVDPFKYLIKLQPQRSKLPLFSFLNMSVLLNGSAYMSNTIRNEQESFHMFFQTWIAEQDRQLHELLSVSNEESPALGEDEEKVLRPLINAVLQHYEEYYQVKSKWSKVNVLTMLSPTWTTSLEDAFLWIGGWRPSMAFHLLYSKSGMHMEAKLAEVIQGLCTNDLGGLSPSQLTQVDELQRKTVTEERKLTEKMAKHQETVADESMVELSQLATELPTGGIDDDRVDSTLAPKEEGLLKILEKADDLRLRTLKGVISILQPIQTVHFLVAAAELHLRIHDWGQKKDNTLEAMEPTVPPTLSN